MTVQGDEQLEVIHHIKIGLRCSMCFGVIEDSLPPGHERKCEICEHMWEPGCVVALGPTGESAT